MSDPAEVAMAMAKVKIRFVTRSTVTGRVLKVHARDEARDFTEAQQNAAIFLDAFGRETGSWKTTREAQFVGDDGSWMRLSQEVV